MKNKEKFKNEILDIICGGDSLAVDMISYKPVACSDFPCSSCLFYGDRSCSAMLAEWAKQEYKEPIVISISDFRFLEYIPKKYKFIARDYAGELIAYESTPIKSINAGFWICGWSISLSSLLLDFPMVKWTDEQPWKISDLKKLKVVKNY